MARYKNQPVLARFCTLCSSCAVPSGCSKKRHAEKATMKKTIAMHQQRDNKHKADDGAPQSAVPAYLLEREQVTFNFLSLVY